MDPLSYPRTLEEDEELEIRESESDEEVRWFCSIVAYILCSLYVQACVKGFASQPLFTDGFEFSDTRVNGGGSMWNCLDVDEDMIHLAEKRQVDLFLCYCKETPVH